MILFLQNAWSPLYAGGEWPRESWLRALDRSRSGQRLKLMIDDLTICHNTTPIVGEHPGSKIKPDKDHVKRLLEEHEPDVVIACGKQAEEVLPELWAGYLLCVPHPAARLLTDRLYKRARLLLKSEYRDRGALRQLKGRVKWEPFEERTSCEGSLIS